MSMVVAGVSRGKRSRLAVSLRVDGVSYAGTIRQTDWAWGPAGKGVTLAYPGEMAVHHCDCGSCDPQLAVNVMGKLVVLRATSDVGATNV